MEDPSNNSCVEAVVQYVRKEFERVAHSGANWKIILNGSAGGEVRAVVETYETVLNRHDLVNRK